MKSWGHHPFSWLPIVGTCALESLSQSETNPQCASVRDTGTGMPTHCAIPQPLPVDGTEADLSRAPHRGSRGAHSPPVPRIPVYGPGARAPGSAGCAPPGTASPAPCSAAGLGYDRFSWQESSEDRRPDAEQKGKFGEGPWGPGLWEPGDRDGMRSSRSCASWKC